METIARTPPAPPQWHPSLLPLTFLPVSWPACLRSKDPAGWASASAASRDSELLVSSALWFLEGASTLTKMTWSQVLLLSCLSATVLLCSEYGRVKG
jgi:hypothetical protein